MRWSSCTRSLPVAAAVLLGVSCGGSLKAPTDAAAGDGSSCSVTGPGPAPLCNVECNSRCGCARCAPSQRDGIYTCTNGGCYDLLETDAGSWTQSSACRLPFDPGSCDALFPVYAFVNGACVPRVYGGCDGNGNRFSTLEECLAACEGRPDPNGCPAGRIVQTICVACGPAGGCGRSVRACALTCDPTPDAAVCPDSLPFCASGVCQLAGCI